MISLSDGCLDLSRFFLQNGNELLHRVFPPIEESFLELIDIRWQRSLFLLEAWDDLSKLA